MSKKEKVTTTDFYSACTLVLCMHAWEFSDAIYNTLLRKRGVFIRLKPAQVFNWPFHAILFQQDSLKRKISKDLLTKICFFRFSQRHLVHALWRLAKHCGHRSQNACQAMYSLSRDFCWRLLSRLFVFQRSLGTQKNALLFLCLSWFMFMSRSFSLQYKLL